MLPNDMDLFPREASSCWRMIGQVMTLQFRPALDRLAHVCGVSQHYTSICARTHAHIQGDKDSVMAMYPLRSPSICFLAEITTVCVSMCVAAWFCGVFVCVYEGGGQMACGSSPKWNRPSFVGDIMTYLQWFLEALVALCNKVEPSRWTCGWF